MRKEAMGMGEYFRKIQEQNKKLHQGEKTIKEFRKQFSVMENELKALREKEREKEDYICQLERQLGPRP
jgi:septal ring factor EnvC (AmiA/AmiB activator)